jgi:hypothetical protein
MLAAVAGEGDTVFRVTDQRCGYVRTVERRDSLGVKEAVTKTLVTLKGRGQLL